ncbi:MAG TPA: hypothetical protein VHD63_22740 [Ktedonobacteraceae bacterium]|nr:hypothetical protein [Ktedonobacteraceae bacterium]
MMKQIEMTGVPQNLARELRDDEQLLWWGQPDPRHRAVSKRYPLQVSFYSVLAILCLLVNVVMLKLALIAITDSIFPVLILLLSLLFLYCLFLALFFLVFPWSIASKLARTLYGITNRRVIVLVQGRRGPVIHSHTHVDFGPLERHESGDGWGDLFYGRFRITRVGTIQIRVLDQLSGIPDVRKVEELLLTVFKKNPSAAPARRQD